ncbi:MAG TPA: metalloregulator ArsR/SmtB family transcription factor [candidate division Zixibacteria bacterium]|nr:metalloregulator ArsR/SmtB family transcription factor [candidate division Zixibacteria bacterium]
MKAATDKLSIALRAIADPTRRKILRLLQSEAAQKNGDETLGWCAGDLESKVHLSQPTISHHMKILKSAGLVESRKSGTWVCYQRDENAIRSLRKTLKQEL